MFILVRTVHTIKFYLSYFTQHQKIVYRDYENLEGTLVDNNICRGFWLPTVAINSWLLCFLSFGDSVII